MVFWYRNYDIYIASWYLLLRFPDGYFVFLRQYWTSKRPICRYPKSRYRWSELRMFTQWKAIHLWRIVTMTQHLLHQASLTPLKLIVVDLLMFFGGDDRVDFRITQTIGVRNMTGAQNTISESVRDGNKEASSTPGSMPKIGRLGRRRRW